MKNTWVLHCLLFIGVVIGVTAVAIHGVVVNQSYGPLPLKSFFETKTYAGLHKKTPPAPVLPIYTVSEGGLFSSDGTQILELEVGAQSVLYHLQKDKTLISYKLKNYFTLIDLASKDSIRISFTNPSTEFLGIYLDSAILSEKNTNGGWITRAEKIQALSGTPVTTQIEQAKNPVMPVAQLLQPFQSFDKPVFHSRTGSLSYATCTPLCSIIVWDVTANKNIVTVPVFTDASFKPAVSEVQLLFVDVPHGLVGYQLPTQEVYVVNFDIELLQNIRLENDRNEVQFIGYFPATKQLLFKLQERSGDYTQLALYSADAPSLHLLQKFPSTTNFSSLFLKNAVVANNKVFDLSGNEQSVYLKGEVISGQ
jgi:hypothetical protein